MIPAKPNGILTFTSNGVPHLEIVQRELAAKDKVYADGVKEGRRIERAAKAQKDKTNQGDSCLLK